MTEAVLLLREHQAAFDVLSYALPTLCPVLTYYVAPYALPTPCPVGIGRTYTLLCSSEDACAVHAVCVCLCCVCVSDMAVYVCLTWLCVSECAVCV